jgi:hypothetical protein
MEKLKSFDPMESSDSSNLVNIDVLRQWYKAHKIAAENPRILLKYYGSIESCKKASDLCAQRMKECEEADEKLFALDHPLVNLFKDNQMPDCSCKYQSNSKKIHPECKEKVKDFFAYRDSLMFFVFERYIKNTEFMYDENLLLIETERAEDITEIVLTKLSEIPVVGDALESISPEAYDKIEQDLVDSIEKRL